MSVVRSEFGPTLPELLRPRLAALPRPVRIGLAALAALVLLLALWALVLRGSSGLHPVVVRRPVAFNFVYRAPFRRLAPRPGELARVGGSGGQSLAVRELRLPAYTGDAAGFLPGWEAAVAAQMQRELPGFQVRSEGRANINTFQGYEMVFQYRLRGRLAFGRRVFLLPETTARQGIDIIVVSPRSPAVANADAAGHNGPLKTSLRSFRFGTQRP